MDARRAARKAGQKPGSELYSPTKKIATLTEIPPTAEPTAEPTAAVTPERAFANRVQAASAKLRKKAKTEYWRDDNHTEYKQIGLVLAEALGLMSEAEMVKSTRRTEVAKTKEKRKDVPKKTIIQTKGSDSSHVATITTNPGKETVTHQGETIPKKEFKKRLQATGHKFKKVTNPRKLRGEK